MTNTHKPIVIITGSAGNVGTALRDALKPNYCVVGCDRPGAGGDVDMDVASDASVTSALKQIRERFGSRIAAVVHLAAYFDFSGEESPLYDTVNVKGTERLLKGLQDFEVERFIYSGTMLVHAPCERGELIDESSPISPKWAYPESKAKAEEAIRERHGDIPYTILRLAGLYDEDRTVPTLAHQIARIYEEDIKSRLYAGDLRAGQAFIHKTDMVELFKSAIDRRGELPEAHAVLGGEVDVIGYDDLQNIIGDLIHGEEKWTTLSLPPALAKVGAYAEEKAEPIIPDAFDEGETPFVKPFMADMASDHYALNISEAKKLLDWQPKRRLKDALPDIIARLKKDPIAWYEKNGVTPPDWMESAEEKNENPETLRRAYAKTYEKEHKHGLWAHFFTVALGFWLISSPFTLDYQSAAMTWSDIIAGALVMVTGACSLSSGKWLRLARFDTALVGLWVMAAPLVFWAPTAAAYLNGTLVGALTFALALAVRPFPAMSPVTETSGPEIPPGWDFTPSSWFQRIPVILLAFVGFYISRYMAAYQLGHVDAVWDPFFNGNVPQDDKNGTEEIITSSVSKAWPVPDAGLGALTYLLEILTGVIGSNKRWRTMPWLVLLFGFMIIPLGAISITFIIIQPIILGTWCTLCLIAAAAMLLQIPYSFDEVAATIEFLRRRARKGRPWLKILFAGDTDEGERQDKNEDDFTQPARAIVKRILAGGISVPWNLALSAGVGIWLMFTRVTLGADGNMANADHLIGALTLTFTVTAFAEVARAVRFLNVFLGAALLITPFIFEATPLAVAASVICGFALIGLSFRRGAIKSEWGEWNNVIV